MTDTSDDLWTPRSVDDTQKVYDDWAATYDADVRAWGYATPGRIAMALRRAGANPAKPVLDYGCGTGLCGMTLKAAGFDVVDGTDINPAMLAQAEARGVYRQVWTSAPGDLGHIKAGDYPILVACGVIGLGAAPAEVLDLLVDALGAGGLLAFSFSDVTMADRSYTNQLDIALLDPTIELAFEEDGPHLTGKDMTATVFVLRKT